MKKIITIALLLILLAVSVSAISAQPIEKTNRDGTNSLYINMVKSKVARINLDFEPLTSLYLRLGSAPPLNTYVQVYDTQDYESKCGIVSKAFEIKTNVNLADIKDASMKYQTKQGENTQVYLETNKCTKLTPKLYRTNFGIEQYKLALPTLGNIVFVTQTPPQTNDPAPTAATPTITNTAIMPNVPKITCVYGNNVMLCPDGYLKTYNDYNIAHISVLENWRTSTNSAKQTNYFGWAAKFK